MTAKSRETFKQQLIHLRSDFNSYLRNNNTKAIPIKHLVIILQKYLKIQPTSIETILSRTVPKDEITWQQLLIYLQNQLQLQNQVNKMKLVKPSIIDLTFYPVNAIDQHLSQKISDIIIQIKKKNTNYIKFMKKAQFLGFKMLVTVLQRQTIFYDCQTKCIIRKIQFRYNNVRNKLLSHHINANKQKSNDIYNNSYIRFNAGSPDLKDNLYNNPKQQKLDKVPAMTRRTQQLPHSYQFKSRKNTVQTQQLKNILTTNMKNSKVVSSVCSQSNQFNNVKRSITMMDNHNINNNSSLIRQNTRLYRFGSLQKQKQKNKKQILKIRSNDTAKIFKLITQNKIQGSIQTIKAYKNSLQTFQKYIQIDKSKLQKQKQLFQQYKLPSTLNIKFDYKKQIMLLKQKSHQLSNKKKYYQSNRKYQHNSLYHQKSISGKKSKLLKLHRMHTENIQLFSQSQHLQHHNQNAFINLQKKVLEIQSISICDHYMLVSLMNCQIRLYSFKKTIHGFMEQLIFQKNYQSVVVNVMIYRSVVRKMYNICAIIGKFIGENGVGKPINKTEMVSDLKNNTNGAIKSKQTQIFVYQLDSSMKIQKQSSHTYLSYTPVIVQMLPLGIAGFIQSGHFFLVELNGTSSNKSQQKTIDTCLYNSDTGKRVSISCLKCHLNLVNLYIGCKDGSIYIYDRLSKGVRIKGKVMNVQIIQIMFIGQNGNQMLVWDVSGKIGIVGTESLAVSLVVGVMGAVGKNIQGGGATGYSAMLEYFLQNQYLVYGYRTMGVISLYQNEQKKFNAEKPIKILNRRQLIKNKTKALKFQKISSSNSQQIQQKPSQFYSSALLTNPPTLKKIHKIFCNPTNLIFSTWQGQIILYNQCLTFIGSYFTLNYSTLTQCITNQQQKYLFLLHENNQMQIINLYTQQQVINLYNIKKQQVLDIFFCNSQIYFCGYLTIKKFNLYIFGYTDGKISKEYQQQPLIVISLASLVIQNTRVIGKSGQNGNEGESKFSKISNLSLSKSSSYVDVNIKFYKGSPFLIKSSPPQIIFLYKKTYARNTLIKLTNHICQLFALEPLDEPLTIVDTHISPNSNILSLILNNNTLVLINIQTKTIRNVYKLQLNIKQYIEDAINKYIQPIQHFYQQSTDHIIIVWKINQQNKLKQSNQYLYTFYILSEYHTGLVLQPKLVLPIININNIPLNKVQKIKQKQKQLNNNNNIGKDSKYNKNRHKYKFYSTRQQQNPPQHIDNWISQPFILGKHLLTLHKQYTYLNIYKINLQQISIDNKQQQHKLQSYNKQFINQDNRKEIFIQYYKIQPQ